MATTPLASFNSSSNLLQLPIQSPAPTSRYLLFTGYAVFRSTWPSSLISLQRKNKDSMYTLGVKVTPIVRGVAKSTEESGSETLTTTDSDDELGEDNKKSTHVVSDEFSNNSSTSQRIAPTATDSLSLGIREPIYEVVEVKSDGVVSRRKINRRHLLKSSGLRPRDVRSVDPSLWLTNTMPSLLVREHAILLNLGSLRAIAMQDRVFIFNYERKGGKAFIDALLPRLNPKSMNGNPSMPFELEVVEAALNSRIQRLENRLMDLEPRVQALLEVLPNKLTADILEQLRISKQTLVELGSKAGALKQMLLDILEDPHEIRRICIMGRNCTLTKINDDMECSVPLEKQIADEEEEEIEMLLENYLQRLFFLVPLEVCKAYYISIPRSLLSCWSLTFYARIGQILCESCHGQAERLLDSAREMEDSIAVNLSSRRLEVSRFELLLQVGTFCVAVGALVAGIFGMNLKSYLEEQVSAFWLTTGGIIVGAVIAFFMMYSYLRAKKIF